jgi:DNA-binding NarL/FixJ family response regulator
MYETKPGSNPEPARIVISGDQAVMRAAICRLVESDASFAVVRDCDNSPEALTEALAARPDLILMDLDLNTRCSGALERIGVLLRATAGTPVLILTATDDCQATQFALHHGAIGFVLKHRSPEALPRAIRAGLAGEMWLEQSTMAVLFRDAPASNGNDGSKLTPREREIIDLVVLGLQNKVIAKRLCISSTTVRHHLTSIFEKLDVSNRMELMRFMFEGVGDDARLPAFAMR